jgi:hypothetical protein
MAFDMTAPLTGDMRLPTRIEEMAERAVLRQRGLLNPDIGPHPGWLEASESVRMSMIRHTNPVLADYDMPLPTGIPRERWREFYEAVTMLARADWAGEPSYILAVIGLLNARNAVEAVAPDMERLNKARRKRGVPPLFEHKVLKIANRRMTRPAGESGGDHAHMRQHFCRGHFKKRATGIFFWHPHLRGDPERGKIEKEYEL